MLPGYTHRYVETNGKINMIHVSNPLHVVYQLNLLLEHRQVLKWVSVKSFVVTISTTKSGDTFPL